MVNFDSLRTQSIKHRVALIPEPVAINNISSEPSFDENGNLCISPFHILQQEAEPNVTEELSSIINYYILNTPLISKAIENIIENLIQKAKNYPDNYSIIIGSLMQS